MGVTGALVRSIFSRNKSFLPHEHNGRSNVGERKRWSSVRSYLCGDEFNSVLAVDESKRFDNVSTVSPPLNSASSLVNPLDSVLALEDSASVKTLDSVPANDDSTSVKSSEATVTQPLQDDDESLGRNVNSVKKNISDEEDNPSEATETHIPKTHKTPISKLFREEDAAIIIQTAFRSYLAARRDKDIEEAFSKEESFVGGKSPSKEPSMGTSMEVQTGTSVNTFSFVQERASANHRGRQKMKTQVLKMKEEWDDSTVSSTISKMRIQNRIEAMTRRERALAYAFSQQLRICSKKKQIEQNEVDHNIGWSWLERWMATRVPESISVEQGSCNQTEPVTRNQILVVKKRPFGVAGELESCASNDVSLQLETISETLGENNEDPRPGKISLKATRNISKRKSAPTYQIQKECAKLQATKRDLQRETQKFKKAKSTPSGCKGEMYAKKL